MGWLDNLHCEKKIIERLIDLDGAKKFAQLYSRDLDLRGYLFLIEVNINAFINSSEFLIYNSDLFNMLTWGDPDQGRDEIRKILNENCQEVKFITDLESIRKKLSKLRYSKTIEEKELRVVFLELSKKINEIYNHYLINIQHVKSPDFNSLEKSHYINIVYNIINYIESDLGLGKNFEETEIKPLFVAGSHYHLMTSEARKNYHLQNPKNDEKVYAPSYALGLAWLYSLYVNEDKLIKKLIACKGWEELHHGGSRIIEFYDNQLKKEDKEDPFKDLFEEKQEFNSKTIINKSELRDIGELRIVLRDRELREIGEVHDGDYPTIRSLLKAIIRGLLEYSDEDNKLEIVELKIKGVDEEDIRYSYLVFLPVGGALWNASNWILFKDISTYSSCDFKESLHRLFQDNSDYIDFRSYFVTAKDFEKYRKRKDLNYMREIERLKQIESSQGLLLEFLSLYYSLSRNKEKIVDFGWHSDPSNKHHTDLDAYIITLDRGIIIQAKKSISIRDPNFYADIDEIESNEFDPLKELKVREDLESIKLFEHFKKTEEILKNRAKEKGVEIKKIDKILFVFEKDLKKWILDELIKELDKEKINFISFEDIEKDREIFDKDFIDKINFVFDRIFYPDNGENEFD